LEGVCPGVCHRHGTSTGLSLVGDILQGTNTWVRKVLVNIGADLMYHWGNKLLQWCHLSREQCTLIWSVITGQCVDDVITSLSHQFIWQ